MKKLIHLLFLILSACFTLQVQGWSFFGTKTETPALPIQPTRFTIMIDPAGDARDAGREIHDMFERGVAMQCAEELKRCLELRSLAIRALLTRFPGEIVEPLQNAAFANRLKVNLYLSLHFYETKDKKPQVHLYQVVYNPGTDLWAKKGDELILLPYDQAYKLSIKKTETYINSLYERLKEEVHFVTHPPLGIPLKPLAGIIAPAISVECGLTASDEWKKIVPQLCLALEKIIEDTQNT